MSSAATPTVSAGFRTDRPRFPRWVKVSFVVIVLALVAAGILMSRMSHVPADLNTASTRTTEHGLFTSSYQPQLEPIAINQIHSWTFHLETADGEAVENAEITVDGGMPDHGHGLPTVPQVTEYLGDGNYRVEGMKFNMPGWWVVTFDISANGDSDSVTFNLVLE